MSLKDLCKTLKPDALKILKKSFQNLIFSFFVHWEPNDSQMNVKSTLDSYFGSKRVIKCLNRVDTKIVECQPSILKEIYSQANDIYSKHNMDNFVLMENLIGCLDNQIDL